MTLRLSTLGGAVVVLATLACGTSAPEGAGGSEGVGGMVLAAGPTSSSTGLGGAASSSIASSTASSSSSQSSSSVASSSSQSSSSVASSSASSSSGGGCSTDACTQDSDCCSSYCFGDGCGSCPAGDYTCPSGKGYSATCWQGAVECKTVVQCPGETNFHACSSTDRRFNCQTHLCECPNPMYPRFCPASATAPSGCWGEGTDCRTITDCSGTELACSVYGSTLHCDTNQCSCDNPMYPTYCPALGNVGAACWTSGVDCSTVVVCADGVDHACFPGSHYDCATKACIAGTGSPQHTVDCRSPGLGTSGPECRCTADANPGTPVYTGYNCDIAVAQDEGMFCCKQPGYPTTGTCDCYYNEQHWACESNGTTACGCSFESDYFYAQLPHVTGCDNTPGSNGHPWRCCASPSTFDWSDAGSFDWGNCVCLEDGGACPSGTSEVTNCIQPPPGVGPTPTSCPAGETSDYECRPPAPPTSNCSSDADCGGGDCSGSCCSGCFSGFCKVICG